MSHKKDGSGDQVFVKGNGVFRQGAVHLMLYALDPLGKGKTTTDLSLPVSSYFRRQL
jgi:hypothetical protein